MNVHRSPLIRALIFLLLVGPLQAQQVFACGMMDAVFLDDCCCEDHNNCDDADHFDHGDAITPENQCCEESIQLSFNDDASNDVGIIKSVEIRSDVDPPVVIVFADDPFVEHVRFSEISVHYTSPHYSQGSNTYLVTQRLRI